MKPKEVEQHLRQLLTDETALTPLEASKILGCRDRDVREYLKPSFYQGGRPKYVAREVFKVRDRMMEATRDASDRNRQMVRRAATA